MPISPTGKGLARGFTLVELLIALMISGLILAAVVSAFSTVLHARKLQAAHAADMQVLRQLYQEVHDDFANACLLPEMDASRAGWEAERLHFPTRNAAGETGILELSYKQGVLWKAWTPVNLSKLKVKPGRLIMHVDLGNVSGVVTPPGQIRYAIAENIEQFSLTYDFPPDDPTLVRKHYRWPLSVTVRFRIKEKEQAAPLDVEWICPLIQESPWQLRTEKKKTASS